MNITSIGTSFNVLPYSRLFSKQKVLQESKIKISKINISKIAIFEEIQIVVHIQIIKNVILNHLRSAWLSYLRRYLES